MLESMGFNKKGREYLNYLKKYEKKKIITSLKNIQDNFSMGVVES